MGPLALARPESEEDRRHVRHFCGHGCVRCGATVFQYRSVSGSANPDDLILLCPACAHALTGQPGAERALRAMRANPLARQKLFDRRKLPYFNGLPDVTVTPGVIMQATPVPILFAGVPVLRLDPPEVQGGATGFSVALGVAGGEPRPIIVANEWRPDAAEDGDGDWVFERPANHYVITSRDRSAQLILAILTPGHWSIELLRTHGGGRMLEAGLHGTRVDGVARPTPPSKAQLVGMVV
ncbi:hypothetical protein BH10PSE13_BH10PSE13_15020 [soil metagenome]